MPIAAYELVHDACKRAERRLSERFCSQVAKLRAGPHLRGGREHPGLLGEGRAAAGGGDLVPRHGPLDLDGLVMQRLQRPAHEYGVHPLLRDEGHKPKAPGPLVVVVVPAERLPKLESAAPTAVGPSPAMAAASPWTAEPVVADFVRKHGNSLGTQSLLHG